MYYPQLKRQKALETETKNKMSEDLHKDSESKGSLNVDALKTVSMGENGDYELFRIQHTYGFWQVHNFHM